MPQAACPSVAAALATSGLNAACKATSSAVSAVTSSSASSAVSSITSQLAGFGIDSVLNAVGGWVTDGASWLVTQIGAVITNTTTVDLGASWFASNYETMMALAGVVIVPMLLLGIMQAVYRQNGSMLIRSVLLNVPLALLLTAVAIKMVSLGLAVTDAMSSAVSHGAGLDAGRFLSTVSLGLSTSGATQPSIPTFVLFIAGLVVVFGALMVWVELLIRSAAIYVAVLFLPLVLASLAWPAIAHWCRRLVDTLVALILGKFVIVAVLSLAAGALAGGVGTTVGGGAGGAASGGAASGGGGSGAGGGTGSGGGGFAAVLGGAALLLLAAFAPWALFRLLPFIEAGAVSHLEGLSHRARQTAALPVRGLAVVAMRPSGAGSAFGARGGAVGALVGSTAGSLGAGASGDGPGNGPGDGPGGDGPPGTRPDSGPSSAERTGVGTLDSPGHGIPAWAVHPEATAAARRHFGDLSHRGVTSGDDGGPDPVEQASFPSAGPGGASAPAPEGTSLPPSGRSSLDAAGGSSLGGSPFSDSATALGLPLDRIGHDDLGVRLIPAPRPRGPLPLPAAPSTGPVPPTPTTDPTADGGR